MPIDKSYDGQHVVVHVVSQGESLSRIAENYGLPNWEAIWLYNTQVREVHLGDDPDKIHPGERLFIPRSPKGYDTLISRLDSLKRQMAASGDQQLAILEGQHYEYKAWETAIDFAGDVLTTLATFGLKAGSATKAARTAEQTTGRGRVAAQYLADKEAEKLAKWVDSTFKGTATKAAAEKADQYHQALTGRKTSVGANTHKTLSTGEKAIEALRGYSMQGGKFLLNSADIALSFLSPSKVANIYLWLTTGETVEDSNVNARNHVRDSVRRTCETLGAKIERISDERNIVYPPGGSFIGNYMSFPPAHITASAPAIAQ